MHVRLWNNLIADQKFHSVFYFSKRMTETESNYYSFELEILSIVYALRRFRTYLLGLKYKIVTNSSINSSIKYNVK